MVEWPSGCLGSKRARVQSQLFLYIRWYNVVGKCLRTGRLKNIWCQRVLAEIKITLAELPGATTW